MALPVNTTINEPLVQKYSNDYFTKRQQYLNDVSNIQHKLLIEQLIEELRVLHAQLNATNAVVNAHITGPGHVL